MPYSRPSIYPAPPRFVNVKDAEEYANRLYRALVENDRRGEYLNDVAAYHRLLSATHNDTVAATPVKGDVIYANATPAWTRLAAGAEGQVMEMGPELPNWGRKITISATGPSGGSNGDIWLEY